MEISFGNGKSSIIDSELLKNKIIQECEHLMEIKIKDGHFPGSQPVAIEKKDLDILNKKKYVICEKTDGERGILLIINIDNKPMCFMINRKNEFMFLTYSFKKELFEGSIFDGEIIKNKKDEWNYIIHDCMCYNGKNFTKINHKLRYATIIDFITKRYVNKESDCFNIKTKLFYHCTTGTTGTAGTIKDTFEHINKTTENKIDGLIFTPIYEPIFFGRQFDLFKWKHGNNNTVDLFVKHYKNSINLYFYKNGNKLFKSFDAESENYKILSEYYSDNKINLKSKNGYIIEFKYSLKNEIFTPYRIRDDKDKPNAELTVLNTIKNIKEDIQIEDFTF